MIRPKDAGRWVKKQYKLEMAEEEAERLKSSTPQKKQQSKDK
ncbi:MAG: hypothetical protein PUB08_02230 [Firmicutes bacterium]|nr:hypothetical protein [Bacillota bacterium]